ncbi:MAG: hypothetical protein QME51_00355, partial [Planctomycetota bacterium]|nr:hypothetical protein [Planctomycetota bacterium]
MRSRKVIYLFLFLLAPLETIRCQGIRIISRSFFFTVLLITGLMFFLTGQGSGGGGSSSGSNNPPAPQSPSVTTNPADNITSTSARLNGTVNPNGADTDVYFEYGISTTPVTYPISTTPQAIGNGTSDVVVTATIGSLSSNSVYNFRCVATNAEGTIYGINQTFRNWSETISVKIPLGPPTSSITLSGSAWRAMAGTPSYICPDGDLVSTGNDFIYATRGGNTSTFWRYSISLNKWTPMAPTPLLYWVGAILCYPGSGDFIYMLGGDPTANFWRYSISLNRWTAMADT